MKKISLKRMNDEKLTQKYTSVALITLNYIGHGLDHFKASLEKELAARKIRRPIVKLNVAG